MGTSIWYIRHFEDEEIDGDNIFYAYSVFNYALDDVVILKDKFVYKNPLRMYF